ncbi:MAG: carbohydrate ABC transporter permease [Streptosporangiaceae bacterium]
MRSRLRSKAGFLYAYALLTPSLFSVLAFYLLPVIIVFALTFFHWDLFSSPDFVGLGNYRNVLGDSSVWHSLLTTCYYVALTIPLQIIFAILLALLLNQKVRGVKVFRAMYVIPFMATPVVIGLVWSWIYAPQAGSVDAFLSLFGVDGPSWLSNPSLAMPAVAMVHVWQLTGYNMLFFLAGLQNIPAEYYGAASVDGASKVQQFFHITLPLLRPTTFFVLVTDIIGSFQVFDTIYIMTLGGPGHATEVINFKIYSAAFERFDFGYASALALILFLIILTITLLQVRYFSRRTVYDMT